MARLTVLMLLLALNTPLYAAKTVNPDDMIVVNSPEVIISTMHVCYDDENATGVELAKCMLDKLKEYPNPYDYRVSVYADSDNKNVPGVISIVIYNTKGQFFRCVGTTGDNIVIKQCLRKRLPPLTPGQELSIMPPEE